MSQRKITMYTCDRCRVEEPEGVYNRPTEWSVLKLSRPELGAGMDEYDLCATCTAAARNVVGHFIYQDCWTGPKVIA